MEQNDDTAAVKLCLAFFDGARGLIEEGEPEGRRLWGRTLSLVELLRRLGRRIAVPKLPAAEKTVDPLPMPKIIPLWRK